MLLADIGSALPEYEIAYFDMSGRGQPEVVDACLASLSRLTGERYSRANVGYITLITQAQVDQARRYRLSQRMMALADKHPFNLGDLLAASGYPQNLQTEAFARIMQSIPIPLNDARTVQQAVKKLSGMEYSFDELGIIIEETSHNS
jgi:hypothetical protein